MRAAIDGAFGNGQWATVAELKEAGFNVQIIRKKKLPDEVLNYFRREGSRGGTIGSQSLTAAQRKARATKASKAAAAARTKKRLAKKPAPKP